LAILDPHKLYVFDDTASDEKFLVRAASIGIRRKGE
jgi:hypothetical protein